MEKTTKMKRIAIKQIMKLDPCYTEHTLAELFKKHGFGKSATILEIAESGHGAQDILWLLLRPEYISRKELHLFACWCATRALNRERKAGREPDKKSWDAIKAKKKWIAGKITDEELAKYKASAVKAPSSVASSASVASAYFAVCAAFADAGADAAYYAAAASASSAFYAADAADVYSASGKEQKAQLKYLIKKIKSI